MKLASILMGLALCAPPAAAGEPPLGLSGLFDVAATTWSTLDDQARLDFFASRADLAPALGVRAVRFGGGAPDIFSQSALHGTFPWLFCDRVVGVLGERDLDVVVTLEQLVPASQKGAYRQFMNRFVERYDGDADFGVSGAEVQFDHPDLDGSGTVSNLDWDASAAAKQVWAAAHALARVEIGDRVRIAEDAGAIADTDYVGQLGAVQQAVAGAGAGWAVEVAGTDMDHESKNRFVDRLTGVDAGALEAAGAHLCAKVADLDSARANATLDNFLVWLTAAGLGGVEPWVTEISVGAAPAAGGPGPCQDPRCSERTQAQGLVRLVLSALARGYTRVFYAGAVEVAGADTTVGLVTVPAAAALKPTVADLAPRPAYAVWRRLGEILAGGGVSKLGGLPPNVYGVQVASGEVVWFDWTLEVGIGQPYDPGRRKEVAVHGLTSPSLRVVSLWPAAVGASLAADGSVAATWDERLVPVGVGGTAVITVEQDAVWVSPSDEVAGAEVDAPDAGDAVGGGDVAADTGPGSGATKSGGCQGGPASGAPAFALAALAVAAWRRHGA